MNKLKHILQCHPITKTDIISGDNTNLYSKEGKKIIDFEAGIWCTALGHSNSRINAVIVEQINKIMNMHYKLTSDITEVSAVNLLELVHFKDGKAVFLSSGSEAEDKTRAEAYAKLEFPGTYYLAYRDLPEIIRKHVKERAAIDFGCGTGRSTRFLQRMGFIYY
jgi:acetylornithine/succinyldiaminopimelate/putrescine aminotransferase